MATHAPSLYQTSQCIFTHGSLSHVDELQPPTNGKIWKKAQEMTDMRKVDILLPSDCYEALQNTIDAIDDPKYFRMRARLEDVLKKKFLEEYVKTGHVSMFSKGDAFSQNTFKISKGTLTIHLDKETFERTGLHGVLDARNGSDKYKSRWVISYDLTDNSMQHGKRGFERLLHACRNTLHHPIEWLISTNSSIKQDIPGDAIEVVAKRVIARMSNVQSPLLTTESINTDENVTGNLQDFASDLYEWISLSRLQSPRVAAGDPIDPYLSRYRTTGNSQAKVDICKVSWNGLFDPSWLSKILIKLLKHCPHQAWFCIAVNGFSQGFSQVGDEMTLMRHMGASNEYFMWEISHSRR